MHHEHETSYSEAAVAVCFLGLAAIVLLRALLWLVGLWE
jgi:hypothetical protein